MTNEQTQPLHVHITGRDSDAEAKGEGIMCLMHSEQSPSARIYNFYVDLHPSELAVDYIDYMVQWMEEHGAPVDLRQQIIERLQKTDLRASTSRFFR